MSGVGFPTHCKGAMNGSQIGCGAKRANTELLECRNDQPPQGSGADEARVEGAGDGGVGGALDESTAVGEEGDGVEAAAEAEE